MGNIGVIKYWFVERQALALLIATSCLILGGCAGQKKNDQKSDSTAAVERQEVQVKDCKSGKWDPGLTEEEEATIFRIAEDTLKWCASSGDIGKWSFDKYDITDRLKVPTHSFVTLKIRGRLRGCIGSLPPYPAQPMYESVHNNTVLAALRDTRFHGPGGPGPVKADEVDRIDIHVSLLSDSSPIKSLDEFKLGEHGIILTKGHYRAVFLPEVAVEQGWTKEETARQLCWKAGLPENAWREGARFEVFSSVVLMKE